MLPTRTHQPALSLVLPEQPDDRVELSRLMAAAVINPKFCSLLLNDPETALQDGFQGEDFNFSAGERDLILSIRSDSLPDLAAQLSRTFDEHLPLPVVASVQKTSKFIL